MIKKFILIYFLFVSAAFSQELFKSDEYGFEITFPDYMVVKKGMNESPAVYSSINEFTFVNVILQNDTSFGYKVIEDYDLEEFITPIKEMLNNEFPGYTLMDYGRTEINSEKSIYMQYKYIRKTETVRVKQYYMINKFKLYAITTVSNDKESADFEPVFNDCVNSFKFTN